jgi:hypothetical protein
MTNAEVTPGARACAEDNGITVIDRAVLQQWMGQARQQIERRRQYRMRPAGITTGVLGAAVIAVSTVAFQVAASAPSAALARSSPSAVAARSAPAAALAPSSVARAFFAAISRRDWQDVWRLGGQEPRGRPVRHLQRDDLRLPASRKGCGDKPQRQRRLRIGTVPGVWRPRAPSRPTASATSSTTA